MSAKAAKRHGKEAPECYAVRPYKRHFAVWDAAGELVVVAVYRRGAEEVVRRLSAKGKCPRCRKPGGEPCASP
jgi:hypothetical protein